MRLTFKRRFKIGVAVAAASAILLVPVASMAGAAPERAAVPDRGVYTVSGLKGIADRNEVTQSGVDVLLARHETMTVVANPRQASALRAAGFDLDLSADAERFLAQRSGGVQVRGKKPQKPAEFLPSDEKYHTYDEMITEVKQAATDHGDIVQLSSLGKSYEGRDLPIIKISDNAGTDEDEPEVLFTCNMHAREHLTTEMCLHIIQRFTNGYGSDAGSDAGITSLVDSSEIYVVPQVNPDGITYDIARGKYAGWRA